ncbi:hypothetical protein L249_6616 [Ophiocordyceps polyrhachis-furcata BCC 54312]|uniref:Uncharacterized protein n=1 Tax=Ophiocordyceps polyrhachis-furcata BCC 54312 TaxID=1330021 RepID=A0A367LLT0_9HYPO|nr:hypothetical protein L249_6616 [Ophiocordyceps polyrhachis-furcata BCC 54312]
MRPSASRAVFSPARAKQGPPLDNLINGLRSVEAGKMSIYQLQSWNNSLERGQRHRPCQQLPHARAVEASRLQLGAHANAQKFAVVQEADMESWPEFSSHGEASSVRGRQVTPTHTSRWRGRIGLSIGLIECPTADERLRAMLTSSRWANVEDGPAGFILVAAVSGFSNVKLPAKVSAMRHRGLEGIFPRQTAGATRLLLMAVGCLKSVSPGECVEQSGMLRVTSVTRLRTENPDGTVRSKARRFTGFPCPPPSLLNDDWIDVATTCM